MRTYLPVFTDLFTEYVANITLVSTTATEIVVTTSSAHGLTVGGKVVLSGGKVLNDVANVAIVDDQAVFTTTYDHDLIMPSQINDDQTLELSGFTPSVWDGTHDIKGVANRRTFTIDIPTGETLAPSANGDLLENRNDWWGMQTISAATTLTFSITLSGSPDLPIGTIDGIKIIKGFRIYATADFQRAQAIYTKQASQKACAFIIMTDGSISKDANTMNDAVAGFTKQDLSVLRIQRNFSTAIFLPTDDDLSGSAAQDLCYDSIYTSLLFTLFGYEANDGSAISYGAVPTGDGPGIYNSAYYAHIYDWQLPGVLTWQDGFYQANDVAFRDIEQTLTQFQYGELISNIDLDEEPLT